MLGPSLVKRIVVGACSLCTVRRIAIFLVFSYLAFGATAFILQRDLIYFPTAKDFWTCQSPDPETVKLEIDGERVLFNPGDGSRERIIVFYHGNADSACNWRFIPRHFGVVGDAVLIVEYPGYAGDEREPSEETLFSMVDTVNAWIKSQAYEEVLLVSYSIGGGPASYHASLGADKLLMFAPFDSLIRVVWDNSLYYPAFMLRDKYENDHWLRTSDTKVTIFHGADDNIVSPARSERLAEQIGDRLEKRIVVPDRDHVHLFEGPEFEQIVKEFLVQ